MASTMAPTRDSFRFVPDRDRRGGQQREHEEQQQPERTAAITTIGTSWNTGSIQPGSSSQATMTLRRLVETMERLTASPAPTRITSRVMVLLTTRGTNPSSSFWTPSSDSCDRTASLRFPMNP